MHFETLAIHDGQAPDPHTGSVTVPIYQTSTFAREQLEYKGGFVYSRIGNPTRQALEEALALLENGRYGLAFASGAAATMAALHLLRPGDHIVSGIDIYGGTYRIFEELLRPMGITTSYAEGSTTQSYLDACTPETRVIWVESPSNPLMRLADIRHWHRRPMKGECFWLSTTPFSPPISSALLSAAPTLSYTAPPNTSPATAMCWVERSLRMRKSCTQQSKHTSCSRSSSCPLGLLACHAGLKTLKVRMKEHEANAMQLARFLESHPAVKRVLYPGLSSHPQHILAKKPDERLRWHAHN